MRGFRKSPSQCLKLRRHQRGVSPGAHIIMTEAQTLEQALRIIEATRQLDKAKATREAHKDNPSLRQQIARSQFFADGHDISLANGDVHKGCRTKRTEKYRKDHPKIPHPYRDLPEEAKPAKAREMLASGNWGIGATCGRRLAQLFGVTIETMAEWLGIEVWRANDFNDLVKRKKV